MLTGGARPSHSEERPEHPPNTQVVTDFRSSATLAQQEGRAQDAAADIASRRKRQASWLRRTPGAAFRPRKRHRTAAHEWIQAVNSALKVSCGKPGGLGFFQMDCCIVGPLPDPLSWPHLSIAADRASDGRSAAAFLARKLRINLDLLGDPSHDLNNDMDAALRASDLWAFKTLMLAAYNVQHGPWSEDTRFSQVLEGLDEVYQQETPASCPLFCALAPLMMSDLKAECDDVQDAEEFLWERLFEDGPWRIKYSKVNGGKFLAAIQKFRQEQPWFHMRLFGYLYLALELDMLSGMKVEKLLARRPPEDGALPNEDHVFLRRPPPEEVVIRNSCKNAIVMAVAMFSDDDNLVRQKVISVCSEPWRVWFSDQSHRLRNVHASLAWDAEQVSGAYMMVCYSTMALLESPSAATDMGFETAFGVYGDLPVGDVQVSRQDDFAEHAGGFCLALAGARLKRGLESLRGWPGRAVLMASAETGQACMDMLKHDYELWLWAQSFGDNGLMQKLVERSSFSVPCVQQIVLICQSAGWRWTSSIGEWAAVRFRRFRGTMLIEDGFKRQRRRESRGQSRQGRVERSWAVLVEKKVLSSVHAYTEVSGDQINLERDAQLPSDAFHYSVDSSLPFSKVIGYGKADWYSPSADGAAVEHADHALLRHLRQQGDIQLLRNLWLSVFLKVPGLMLRRRVGGESWYFSIADIPGSAGLGWRAKLVHGDGRSAGDLFLPVSDRGGPGELCLLDMAVWEARVVKWSSPLRSWLASPPAARQRRGLVAQATTEPMSLEVLAARNGFWRFSKYYLAKIGDAVGCSVGDLSETYDMCDRLVRHMLQTEDEEEILQCLHCRAVRLNDRTMACSDAFLEFEETEALLDKSDHQLYKQEKKKVQERQEELGGFIVSYTKKRVQVREAKAKALAAASGKGRGRQGKAKAKSLGGHPWGERRYVGLIVGETITQSEAKAMLPPEASIWESRRRAVGGWHGHYPVCPRISCAGTTAGSHRDAALTVIRQLWRQYLAHHGLPESACPIAGLLSG